MKKILGPVLVLVSALTLALGGCSGQADKQSETSSGASEKITVFASTNVWGSIASKVGGDRVEVTSAVNRPDQDPHDYEATAQDKLTVNKSGIVLVNGGGYDDWASKLAESAPKKPTVLDAVKISGLKPAGEGEFNEHVFYSMATAKKVAHAISEELAKLDQANKATFEANASAFDKDLDKVLADAKGKVKPGGRAVATEPVAGYLLEDLGIQNVTPEEFVEQSETDAGPSVQVTDKTITLITGKQATLLILNPQTEDDVSKKLLSAAQSAKIPVVKVPETFGEGVTDYTTWIRTAADQLAEATA